MGGEEEAMWRHDMAGLDGARRGGGARRGRGRGGGYMPEWERGSIERKHTHAIYNPPRMHTCMLATRIRQARRSPAPPCPSPHWLR